MFEELRRKLNKKSNTTDEITFKPMDEVTEEAPVAAAPQAAEDDGQDSTHLKVIRPESYEEVSNVADALLEGCTVVLNLEAVDRPVMFRMLDFLNGVSYCTDGEIKKVAATTFIITPHTGVDISDM